MPSDSHLIAAQEGDGRFPLTRWSLIQQIGSPDAGDEGDRREALETVCRQYWMPVYVFVRRNGKSPSDAEDITQGFFANLLSGTFFESADPERGRLRNYLLRSLKHFVAGEHKRAGAIKRGGGVEFEYIDAESAENLALAERLADSSLTPEESFERQWAQNLLAAALDRLRVEYEEKGKTDWFAALHRFLSHPEIGDGETVARELGASENAVRIAVHRMRKRYRILIREEIRQTLNPGDDLEEELRYLASLLKRN